MVAFDVVVIGGGPAGLAAALAARRNRAERVVILERDFRLGGILEQCIHTGFGLRHFGEELSGPEYVARFIKEVNETDIAVYLNTTVLSIDSDKMLVHAVKPGECVDIAAGAIVLAMGCRERTRFQVRIPGSRPAGVFTAGAAQRFINVQNCRVGNRFVILGSGDIGMIMARRMTLEGAKVEAIVEIMPYLAGLTRNKVQCLDDFGIPLYLSHTVTEIRGNERITGVTIQRVDEKMQPISGSGFDIECDTLLCSVGLLPENELSKNCGVALSPITRGPIVDSVMQTNRPGIFSCGNVVHVNDLVDNVTAESERAGHFAAEYAKGQLSNRHGAQLKTGDNVRYLVPQRLNNSDRTGKVMAYFRVSSPASNVRVTVMADGVQLSSAKRMRVNPGEIEMVEIDMDKVKALGAQIVSVNVIKEGA